MNPSTILIVFGILIIGVIAGAVYLQKKRNQDLTRLWNEYQSAIRSKNRQQALAAGRRYYAKTRGGRLSIYDEQAIANDLATM